MDNALSNLLKFYYNDYSDPTISLNNWSVFCRLMSRRTRVFALLWSGSTDSKKEMTSLTFLAW